MPTPITALLSEDPYEPIVLHDSVAALEMALVYREAIGRLEDEWALPGAYVLLDRHDADGTWGAYVGKAPSGVKSRLSSHLRSKDHWYRALLVRRDTRHGFNSAQVAWLESRLYDLLHLSSSVVLSNGNRPSDETLPAYELGILETCAQSMLRVLSLTGHVVIPAAEVAEDVIAVGSEPGRRIRTTVVLIAMDLIKVGTQLGLAARFPTIESAARAQSYLASQGAAITWRPDIDPGQPVRWSDAQWSPTRLCMHLMQRVGVERRSVNGAEGLVVNAATPSEKTLAQIAIDRSIE